MKRGTIKKIASKNWFIYDFILRNIAADYNSRAIAFTQRISQIDSIADFELFKEEMNRVPDVKLGTTVTIKRAYSENTLYGYAYSLMLYAEIPEKDIIYLPIVEHGIPFGSDFTPERYPLNNSYIFQGKYAMNGWNQTFKNRKMFFVGPLIHYCPDFYSKKQISKMKEKLGRTALIFLPHSSEENKIQFNVDNIINTYLAKSADNIESVLVCVYCQDVNQIGREALRDRKIHYVSAGFKLDSLFISRLKAIIELSDIVFYDSFSSSIGYSYYLGKKIVTYIDEIQLEKWGKQWGNEACTKLKQIAKLFPINEIEDKRMNQEKFIDKYWGISNIRDKEYIRKIVEFNKKRIRQKIGFI
ncbi:MAG: hypothetical protein HFG66_19110 [Hungatella sp.]|nr:hypothetical protein [Hungatella sp.]